MPSPTPFTLKTALEKKTVAQLKILTSYLTEHIPTRKQELVDKLASELLSPQLHTLWERLDPLQRAAVAETLYLGNFDLHRFVARHGGKPAFNEPSAQNHYAEGKATALCLFIHADPVSREYGIPSDLQPLLRKFVPAPETPTLTGTDELPEEEALTVSLTERQAQQEAAILLCSLEPLNIQVSEKTAQPSAASQRAITEKLIGGDYYPATEKKKDQWEQEIGPIRAFAWPLLLQAGGLATRTGRRLTMTPAGTKALSASPAETLRTLWKKWQKSTLLDEYARIDTVKGQGSKGHIMTALAPRRAAIEQALCQCPPGQWVSVDAFSRFMLAADLRFEVTHAPWQLYVCDAQYGSLGHYDYGGWNILQERYILACLFEYAATLGLVDVAFVSPEHARQDFCGLWGTDEFAFFSRYDGLRYMRLTPLGAWILGLTDKYQPAAPATNLALQVLPSLQIKLTQGTPSPEESLLLDNWAEPLSPGLWRLDREKSLVAVEKGFDINELRRFLEARDDMPLPEQVDSLLRQSERNGKALRLGSSAVLVQCRDAEIAAAIASHKETAALCLLAGDTNLVVRNEHLEKFRERVRILGFGMGG